jgi:hypothetical protein
MYRARRYRWGTVLPEMIKLLSEEEEEPKEPIEEPEVEKITQEKVVTSRIQKEIVSTIEESVQLNNEIIIEKQKIIQDNRIIEEAVQKVQETQAQTEEEQVEKDTFLEKSQERLNENESSITELNKQLVESNNALDDLQSNLDETEDPGVSEDKQIEDTEKLQKEVEELSQQEITVVKKPRGKMRFNHVYWLDGMYPCILKDPDELPKEIQKGKRDYLILHFDGNYQWLTKMQARKDLEPFYVDDPEIESDRKICEFLKIRVHPEDVDTFIGYVKEAKEEEMKQDESFNIADKDKIEEEIKLHYDQKIADVAISSLEDENEQMLENIIQEEFYRINVFTKEQIKDFKKNKMEKPDELIIITPKWTTTQITLKGLNTYIERAFGYITEEDFDNKTIEDCIETIKSVDELLEIGKYSAIGNKEQDYLKNNSKRVLNYINERLDASKRIAKCVKGVKKLKKPKKLVESKEFEDFLSVLEFLNNVFKYSINFLHNNLKIALLRNDVQTDYITELYEQTKKEEEEADAKELDSLKQQDEEGFVEDEDEDWDWEKEGEEEFVPEEEGEYDEEEEEYEVRKLTKKQLEELRKSTKRIVKIQNDLKKQRKLREKKRKELQAEVKEKKRKRAKKKKKKKRMEETVIDCTKYSDVELSEHRIFSSIMFHPQMSEIFPFNKNNKVYRIGGKVSTATKALKGFLDLAKGARKLAGNAQKFYKNNEKEIKSAYKGVKKQVNTAKEIAAKYGVTEESVMTYVRKGLQGKGDETRAKLREVQSLSRTLGGAEQAAKIINLRNKIKERLKTAKEPGVIQIPEMPLPLMPQQPQMFPMQPAFYYYCPVQPQMIPQPMLQRPQTLPAMPQPLPRATVEEKEKKERVVKSLSAIRDRLRRLQTL